MYWRFFGLHCGFADPGAINNTVAWCLIIVKKIYCKSTYLGGFWKLLRNTLVIAAHYSKLNICESTVIYCEIFESNNVFFLYSILRLRLKKGTLKTEYDIKKWNKSLCLIFLYVF